MVFVASTSQNSQCHSNPVKCCLLSRFYEISKLPKWILNEEFLMLQELLNEELLMFAL